MNVYDEWDLLLEQVSGDTWWMPERVVRVIRPEVSYTYDPQGKSQYAVVQRVDPSLSDYSALVEDVTRAHQPSGECNFPLTAASLSPQLVKALEQREFTLLNTADAWTIDVNAPRPDIPETIEVRRVETLQDLRDMDHVMNTCFERYQPKDEETLRFDLKSTQGPAARCWRFVAYDRDTGEPLATSALNLFHEQRVGFMWGGSTIPDARGRGVYSALITYRMNLAQSQGLKRIGLHALRDSSGPIIAHQGFERHGPLQFWSKDMS